MTRTVTNVQLERGTAVVGEADVAGAEVADETAAVLDGSVGVGDGVGGVDAASVVEESGVVGTTVPEPLSAEDAHAPVTSAHAADAVRTSAPRRLTNRSAGRWSTAGC
jgi:hypothetical protein